MDLDDRTLLRPRKRRPMAGGRLEIPKPMPRKPLARSRTLHTSALVVVLGAVEAYVNLDPPVWLPVWVPWVLGLATVVAGSAVASFRVQDHRRGGKKHAHAPPPCQLQT